MPSVLLSLRAQLREDTGLSPAEAVFGAPIVLPPEFLQGDGIYVDTISKKKFNLFLLRFLCQDTI
jgi:hypothetical protein